MHFFESSKRSRKCSSTAIANAINSLAVRLNQITMASFHQTGMVKRVHDKEEERGDYSLQFKFRRGLGFFAVFRSVMGSAVLSLVKRRKWMKVSVKTRPSIQRCCALYRFWFVTSILRALIKETRDSSIKMRTGISSCVKRIHRILQFIRYIARVTINANGTRQHIRPNRENKAFVEIIFIFLVIKILYKYEKIIVCEILLSY